MANNRIKYNKTGSESDSVFKGNWAINKNTHGGGPTEATGFVTGVDIPAGGYAIYGPGNTGAAVANDSELIEFINERSNDDPVSTKQEAFMWASSRDDVLIVDKNIQPYRTEDLALNIDFDSIFSFNRNTDTHTSIKDLVNGTAVSLYNGGSVGEKGIVLDGTNDLVSVPYVLNTGTNFTIDVWAKTNTPTLDTGVRQTIFSFNTGSSMGYQVLSVEIWGNRLSMFVGNGSSYENQQYDLDDAWAGYWTHYVLINNSGVYKLYVNGSEIISWSPSYSATSAYFMLGSRGSGATGINQLFNGEIASARIYSTAVNDAGCQYCEVSNQYVATKDRFNSVFYNGEFEMGNENFSNAAENTSITYNGAEYSMQLDGKGTFMSDTFIEVDPNKTYSLEYVNRTLVMGGPNGDLLTGGHVGFACYNKDFQFCDRRSVGGRVNTVLTRDLNPGDEYAYVSSSNNGITWKEAGTSIVYRHFLLFPPSHPDYGEAYGYTRIGFGDYNIYYNEITDIGGGELRFRFADSSGNWTTFPDIGYSTLAGTPVANGVAGGTYNYTFYPATGAFGEWTTHTKVGGITGIGQGNHNFRPGTKYIKFMLLKNYSISTANQPYPTILIGKAKFTEESYDMGNN